MLMCESCVYSDCVAFERVEIKYRRHGRDEVGFKLKGGEMYCVLANEIDQMVCADYKSKFDNHREEHKREKNAFEVLGVVPWASTEDIRKSYFRRLSLGELFGDEVYTSTLDGAYFEVNTFEKQFKYIKERRIRV